MDQLLWDGLTFRQEPPAVAARLVAADQAEYVRGKGALDLRPYHLFTGHAAKAEAPVEAAPEPAEIPAGSPDDPPPSEPPMPPARAQTYDHRMMQSTRPRAPRTPPGATWRTHKKACGEALHKDPARVTKAEVEAWLRSFDEGE